jgi:hypothetical protein
MGGKRGKGIDSQGFLNWAETKSGKLALDGIKDDAEAVKAWQQWKADKRAARDARGAGAVEWEALQLPKMFQQVYEEAVQKIDFECNILRRKRLDELNNLIKGMVK